MQTFYIGGACGVFSIKKKVNNYSKMPIRIHVLHNMVRSAHDTVYCVCQIFYLKMVFVHHYSFFYHKRPSLFQSPRGFSYKKPIIGRQVPRKIICCNANYSCQEVPFLHHPNPYTM